MATLGFSSADFDVFKIEGFSARMAQIYALVRPKLLRLGREMAPELARKLHVEFFPHVAKHARRTVNPPPETWCAFGPSAKGYKRYPYLGLCISSAGLHARLVVKSEADHRPEMGQLLKQKAAELSRSLRGTPIARYDNWDFRNLPTGGDVSEALWTDLGQALNKKTGGIDLGYGWRAREAARIDRSEVVDAFAELEALYRICRSVN